MNKAHLTAITRKHISAPLRFLLVRGLIPAGNKILDYGCGRGFDVKFLNNSGFPTQGFDPYWQPKKYKTDNDIVLCTYVLNVVDETDRENIINRLRKAIKFTGKIYISVRRDFKKDYVTKKGTKQYLVKLPFKIITENSQFCIYEL